MLSLLSLLYLIMHTLYTVILLTLLNFDVCASSGEQHQHILAWRSELLSLEECFELPENSDSAELAMKSKRRKGSSSKKNTQVSAKKLKEVHGGGM